MQYSANQIFGFYIECNTGLKWVQGPVSVNFSISSKSFKQMLWLAKFGGMGNISQATSKLANGMNTEIKMP